MPANIVWRKLDCFLFLSLKEVPFIEMGHDWNPTVIENELKCTLRTVCISLTLLCDRIIILWNYWLQSMKYGHCYHNGINQIQSGCCFQRYRSEEFKFKRLNIYFKKNYKKNVEPYFCGSTPKKTFINVSAK